MRPADLVRLLVLAALWGGSFLLYRVVAPVLGSIWAAEARVAVAGLALVGWQALRGPRFAWHGNVRVYVVIGIFNSALPFALFGFAAHALPASYLAIINATSPLFGAAIARLWLGEPLSMDRYIGIVAGLAGVTALVGLGPVEITTATLTAAAACLVAAASYGFAGNYTRSLKRAIGPTDLATGSQLAGAFVLVPLLPFEVPVAPPSTGIVVATLVLALASTAVAYLLYFRLIRDVGATRALTVTFLVPLFAVAWAWLFIGEVPTARMGVGAVLVLVATGSVLRRREPAAAGAER